MVQADVTTHMSETHDLQALRSYLFASTCHGLRAPSYLCVRQTRRSVLLSFTCEETHMIHDDIDQPDAWIPLYDVSTLDRSLWPSAWIRLTEAVRTT
jgi:hypothetical protein